MILNSGGERICQFPDSSGNTLSCSKFDGVGGGGGGSERFRRKGFNLERFGREADL